MLARRSRFRQEVRVFKALKVKLRSEWMSVCRNNQWLRGANFCLLN